MPNTSSRFAFGAMVALASALALAQDKHPPTPPGVAQSEPGMAAYWQDLSRNLRQSTDAHALLTAALIGGLALDADKHARESWGSDAFSQLIQRAEQSAPDDVLVLWIAATQCRPTGARCDDAQQVARDKLSELDSDNAAVWLLDAEISQRAGDHESAQTAFSKAAVATRYDDYMIASVKMLAAQFAAHPPREAVLRVTNGVAQSPQAFANVAAWAIAAALVMPQVGLPFKVCTPDRKPVHDVAKAAECLTLARTMQSGDSLIAVGVGVGLERRLLSDTTDAADVERRWRDHAWMVAQLPALAPYIDGDSVSAKDYRRDLYRSNNERSAAATLMTARGIPLDPPADWKPSWR